MTNDSSPQGHDAQVSDQLEKELFQAALEETRDNLADARTQAPGVPDADFDDIDGRLAELADDADEAEDTGNPHILGAAPAQLDYVQSVTKNLQAQTDDNDALEAVEQSLEGAEEALDREYIIKSAWFAEVDDTPAVYNSAEQTARTLKQQGDIDGQTDDFTLHVVPSSDSDVDDAVAEYPEDNDTVDLGKYDFFLTEKADGGVV